ncbi:MAG: hypothetical protein KGI08_05440 [Thaumarchaeota archaeon]|nr:hypothetical protein [Nitrososphaerota archaeon]MDE1867136.1 hypothetical protein [Nitrososphaerota archaeon]
MPTYAGNNYLLSSMLANLANLDTPLSGVKTGTDIISQIKGDTGNLPVIVTHVNNIDTQTAPIPTHLPNIDTQTAPIPTHLPNIDTQTGGTETNAGNVATNTSTAGVGLNTENVNNKMLSAQKTSQIMGFVGASGLSATFVTSSNVFVSCGISISNVPIACKIVYNLWGTAALGGTEFWQVVANSTVLASGNLPSTSSSFRLGQDYSGNLKNSSGAVAIIQVQVRNDTAGDKAEVLGVTNNISSVICYNGANAIVISASSIISGVAIIGSCQITSYALAIMASSTYPILSIGQLAVSSPINNLQSYTYPQKQAFPNGIPIFSSVSPWNDPDMFVLIDFTGDLLTVN